MTEIKVLWLSNILLPDVCNRLKITHPVVGGWMYSCAKMLIEVNPNIKLAVASLYDGNKLMSIENYAITYFLIPKKGGNQIYNPLFENYFKKIKFEFKPDIIHIHGSEYPHSLAYVKACGSKSVVVSIQGMPSIYSKYYLGGILVKDVIKCLSIRDLIRKDSLLQQQKNMQKRGAYEIELLKEVRHIIGRTSWDLSNTWAINSKANFYFCNETLRASFYKKRWNLENCKKYSIFLSQAHYPIKGIHQIIKALPIILKYFPAAEIFIAGYDFINVPWWRRNGFANYLNCILKNNSVLRKKITFLGSLNENQMMQQYAISHIFLCPSAIENSSNSIGEAQLVGTPCVASYVGGNMDMIKDEESGLLYRFDEIALLAKQICKIFANDDLANSLSNNAHKVALLRHDKIKNASQLSSIYNQIMNENLHDL